MRIDGGVATSTRQTLVDDFQNNANVRAAVLSIKAAGTGITLTVRARLIWPSNANVRAAVLSIKAAGTGLTLTVRARLIGWW